MNSVKFVDGSEDVIEGLGIPYGGPFAGGQDIQGEHFSAKTDFAFSWFQDRPALYQHGLDKDAGLSPVGRVIEHEVKADMGVWTKVQLDRSSEYFDAIKELVGKGKLFFSSGAMAHLVDVDAKSGEIKRWPWVELSLTPTPANPLAKLDFATAKAHYKSAGMELPEDADPEVKAVLDAESRNALSDSDFAYIDSGGGRHLPINDAEHARAAMSRFNQTAFESDSAKAAARKRILAACEKFGIDVSPDSMMMKAASFSDFATLILDGPGLDYESVPIGSHLDVVAAIAAPAIQRTKDLIDRRRDEDRGLSDAKRAALRSAGQALIDLAESSAPPSEGTKGQKTDPALLQRQMDLLRLFEATLPTSD